jgi:hypothetical protein
VGGLELVMKTKNELLSNICDCLDNIEAMLNRMEGATEEEFFENMHAATEQQRSDYNALDYTWETLDNIREYLR